MQPAGQVQQDGERLDRSTRVPIAERLAAPVTRSPSVRLSEAQEGRVWLRSPCALVAYWECPPGSFWGALTAN
jgi:hypothetical protein